MNPEPRFDSVQCLSPAGLHRFAWTEWGARDNPRVVVCVHGLTRQGRDFDALAAALRDDYRVVCPDIAGRGQSAWLASGADYGIPHYVSDCVTLIARLGVAQVDWIGTSMGGLIGMALAALPVNSNRQKLPSVQALRSDDLPMLNPIRTLVLNDIGPVLEKAALARIGEYVGRSLRFTSEEQALRHLRTIHASFGPHTEEEWRALNLPVLVRDGDGYLLHYDPRIGDAFKAPAAESPADPWKSYDQIHCPTLAIRGGDSDLLNPAIHAEMGRRGPKAKLVTFPGVGHAPTLIHSDQISVIRDFLDQ